MLKRIKHPVIFLIFAAFMVFSSASYSQESSEIQAVENSINGIMDFPVNTSGPKLEYTHLWFKQILGGFIFAPWASMNIDNGNYNVDDQTVLAKALGFTNILAIIICLVIGYYLIVGGAINTAAKGEVLGKNWDGPWLAIRTSIGFGMLIPLKGIGGMTLSFSQIAVIWLIMIGSNSATLLWNMIGESIVSGTKISEPNINPGYTEVAGLSSMMACSDLVVGHRSLNLPEAGAYPRASQHRENALTLVRINYADGTPTTIIANENAKNSYGTVYWNESQRLVPNPSKEIKDISFAGECGSIPFIYSKTGVSEWVGDVGDDWNEVSSTSYKKEAKIAGSQAYAKIVIDTINDLIPLMRKTQITDGDFKSIKINESFADKDSSVEHQKFFTEDFYPKFIEVAENYHKKVKNDIYKASVGSDSFVKKIKEEMMYGGWAGAGIWFMELSTIPAIPYQSYNQTYRNLDFKDATVCGIFYDTDTCEEYNNTLPAYNKILREAVSLASTENGAKNSLDANAVPCDSGGNCKDATDISERFAVGFSQSILGFLGNNKSEGSGNPFDNETSLASPFLFLGEMGQTLNDAAYGVFVGMAIVNSVMDYIKAIDQAKGGTAVGIIAKLTGFDLGLTVLSGFAVAILKNMAWLAIGGLFAAALSAMTSGFVLAYVIPFMPITTWILMMAGYMLTVVEAIAAAPLAIVLLFTPEGSGIAGSRFERALNLVTMAILRPSFMVLGLVASITVSFVAFSMMNTFFFKAAEHILVGHLFDTIALLLIYTSLAYQLAKMMVENMHQLPDRIGEWFAGGVSRQFGESRVNDSAEQAVQGAGAQFKSLPTSIMGMQSAMRETKNKSKEADDMEAKSKST